MALYTFTCYDCRHEFDDLWPSETRNPECPLCGGLTKRKFGIPSLKFKGSGFHVTDYGKHGRRRYG